MRDFGTYILALCIAIAIIVFGHHILVYKTASLILAPVSLAWLLAGISPMPVIGMTILASILELTSTLPFGVMAGIVALAGGIRHITHTPTDFTWKNFFELFIGITISIAAIIVVKSQFHINSWASIPLTLAAMQIIGTTLATFAVSVIFHEYTSRS